MYKRGDYKKFYKVTDNIIYGFFKDHRFLSNMYPCRIYYDGYLYKTTEHAYQCSKFHDPLIKDKLRNVDQFQSKTLARNFKLSNDELKIWNNRKLQVMMEINTIKFNNKEFRDKLLNTGTKTLIEGNSWNDKYWGQVDYKGQNNLGKILMNIRTYWNMNSEIDVNILNNDKINTDDELFQL